MMTTAAQTISVIDALAEATLIVGESVRSAVERAADSSVVCGCRGCKAQAVEAAEWASRMLEVDAQRG